MNICHICVALKNIRYSWKRLSPDLWKIAFFWLTDWKSENLMRRLELRVYTRLVSPSIAAVPAMAF
jgi:hypothetical protein